MHLAHQKGQGTVLWYMYMKNSELTTRGASDRWLVTGKVYLTPKLSRRRGLSNRGIDRLFERGDAILEGGMGAEQGAQRAPTKERLHNAKR